MAFLTAGTAVSALNGLRAVRSFCEKKTRTSPIMTPMLLTLSI